jgi:hypothetical protein
MYIFSIQILSRIKLEIEKKKQASELIFKNERKKEDVINVTVD